MCTQFSLLKYIKPPPNKNERKMYNTYEYNATVGAESISFFFRKLKFFENCF